MHDDPKPRSTFAALPNTSWTLIQRIQAAEAVDRQELLDQFLSRYWKPLYAYFRSKGKSASDSEDLVQGFLFNLITKAETFPQKEKTPRFRSWLLACARHHLIDEVRRADAGIRKPPEPIASLDVFKQSDGPAYEPAAGDSPEQVYNDAWRRNVLQTAMNVVMAEANKLGRTQDVQILLDKYASHADQSPTWNELAQSYGLLDWHAAERGAAWVKRHLAKAIRGIVRDYVNSDEEVEDEILELLR